MASSPDFKQAHSKSNLWIIFPNQSFSSIWANSLLKQKNSLKSPETICYFLSAFSKIPRVDVVDLCAFCIDLVYLCLSWHCKFRILKSFFFFTWLDFYLTVRLKIELIFDGQLHQKASKIEKKMNCLFDCPEWKLFKFTRL